MNMKASDFIKFSKGHIGDGYVYGTFGQVYTQSVAKQKDSQYGKKMGADYYFSRCSKWFGKNVCDCVGLFKWFIFKELGVSYLSSWDVSADGAYTSWCQERGVISTMKKEPGIAVFMPGHIGLYIGNGKVIEARGAEYGIVETNLSARPFTKWGRLNWLFYDLLPDGTTAAEVKPTLPESHKGVITGDTVNVRSGPDTACVAVGVVRKGDVVSLLSETDGWWEIAAGKWVSGKYVKPQGNVQTGTITGSVVNVRKGPGTSYLIVGTVKKGDAVTLASSKNGWWEIGSGKWVSGAYVQTK